MNLDSKIPEGPLSQKWTNYKASQKLVNPANKRKLDIIVVGTGLAGASAAASLGALGFHVDIFCIQDSPRRAHSIAAQGGINAAKNYQNDGDSVERLFKDTIKGGDYRAREANVYRLAEVSGNIIDQCVAQGVPFARDYSGLLDNRSFGGAQVSRTFYARGQTGQQLLLGAYGALSREIARGTVVLHERHEMMDLVIVPDKDGKPRARGIIARNLVTGELERYAAHAVVVASGGYGNVYYLSTNAMNSNGSAAWVCHRRGAAFANPCYVQIHPTCIPVHGDYQSKLTLMSESLRNDGRIWVPKKKEDAEAIRRGEKGPLDIAEEDRDYYLERRYPAFGNLVPRDVASRAAKERRDAGYGVGPTGLAVYLDFADAIKRLGRDVVEQKYGNLFQMYYKIVDADPYKVPMMIYPAIHYTWAACGSTTSCRPPSPASSPPARPTSATTAPTASVPRPSCRVWPTATSCCPTRCRTTWPTKSTWAKSKPKVPNSTRPSRASAPAWMASWPSLEIPEFPKIPENPEPPHSTPSTTTTRPWAA